MGIQGLLDHIEGQQTHIDNIRGKSVAIDGHCLLHKTAYRFAEEYVINGLTANISKAVAQIVLDFIQISSHTILIFDGGYLPSKQATNQERNVQRQEALDKAKNESDFMLKRKYLQQAIGFPRQVVEQIAAQVINILKFHQNFYCFLSPYEADPQLISLQRCGLADIIVTLDSDLLLYGPSNVMFRYDGVSKTGFLVSSAQIYEKTFKNIQNSYELRKICILSGCDYVDSLKGVGLIVAQKQLMGQKQIVQCCQTLLMSKQNPYDSDNIYVQNVLNALYTFNYNLVFDVSTLTCNNLQTITNDQVLDKYFNKKLGIKLSNEEVINVSCPQEFMVNSVNKLNKICKLQLTQQYQIVDEEMIDLYRIKENLVGQYTLQPTSTQQQLSEVSPWFKSIKQSCIRE
ncbi:Exonuclease_family protein [Hexamita inflata]|uniref:Exonuclease family protein n=1 Tax=Hexamita inflata TaxID=28002 RepID=A0AA86NSD9_9EUKA|nr:Exonuclease family protein [Hexamita inflata]CAI9951550.1 Exonuclease family protein [Hexamita inflata]